MLSRLSLFFKSLAIDSQQQENEPLSLELACAVLLCEVMRADGELSNEEQDKLSEVMKHTFCLSDQEVSEILTSAIQLSESATDFYQFTSKVNQHYTLEQRMNIVALLWKIAYADGELASIEEHIIRKIADLLHLNHGEYIQVKIDSTPSSS
ncbi:MAG: TerB family tellurite resistance protein [Colwellia sp.]|nr:TerB family tellurite resistance protein [Colwellia sp.]